MTCCIARPVRPTVFTADDIGKHLEFLEFKCECNSCCKRVALFAPRPAIVSADEWLVKVIADIRFGCISSCYAGNVEVDFKNGVILDLMGDYVSIGYKVIEVINTNLEGAVIPPMAFGAMVACCGAGAARGCATRTTEQLTAASGTDLIIPIPPFAYAVQFITDSAFFASTTTVTQSGSGTGGSGATLVSSTGSSLPDPWELANGARSIVINQTSGSPITLEAVFLIGV